jgi:Sec-independent protein translocase protein TatA
MFSLGVSEILVVLVVLVVLVGVVALGVALGVRPGRR